ncbi:hypothetical protein AB990_15320 [Alkalihalobacillus pseudalcaliphilus]|nr:hypothetical protein AB990_15320 [Alkalihalobacillus pseudalcaliphilus]
MSRQKQVIIYRQKYALKANAVLPASLERSRALFNHPFNEKESLTCYSSDNLLLQIVVIDDSRPERDARLLGNAVGFLTTWNQTFRHPEQPIHHTISTKSAARTFPR